jgi:hypothetical protein
MGRHVGWAKEPGLETDWGAQFAMTAPFVGLARGAIAAGISTTESKLLWGTWSDYPKVIINGKEYAQVGRRLYTFHAIGERMLPRGLTTLGRSVSPSVIEEVIRTGTTTTAVRNGVTRTLFHSGSITVVTEQGGRIVVTVITR